MTAALCSTAPGVLDICPACLAQLAEDYPFDHVAVDRGVAGDRSVFAAMAGPERLEVVVTALSRGVTLLDLADRLAWPYHHLQEMLPPEHPESVESATATAEKIIRELWEQKLADVTISARTGYNPSKIGRIRKRLGLPTWPKARAKAGRAARTTSPNLSGGVS
jgi:hypothetical protein